MGDSDPSATFGHVARELGRRRISFLCIREHAGEGRIGPKLKEEAGGVYIAYEKFTRELAGRVIESGESDAVAFGKPFIANPDLPRRFELGAPLNKPNPATFYGDLGTEGYTDYLALEAEVALVPGISGNRQDRELTTRA